MSGMVSGRVGFILLSAIIILGIAATRNSGCLQADAGTGTLTGTVTIGPLCPVEPCTLSRDQLPAAFAARPITLSTPSGATVATVTADPATGYAVDVQPGTYVVDIHHQGSGGSPELPAIVTIHRGETVRLNISIDTGIR